MAMLTNVALSIIGVSRLSYPNFPIEIPPDGSEKLVKLA
jgi:hypothetical protein